MDFIFDTGHGRQQNEIMRLRLNIRSIPNKTIITTLERNRVSFCLFRLTSSKRTSSQAIYHSLVLGRPAIKALENVFVYHTISICTNIRIMWEVIFFLTLYGSESLILKKKIRNYIHSFESGY